MEKMREKNYKIIILTEALSDIIQIRKYIELNTRDVHIGKVFINNLLKCINKLALLPYMNRVQKNKQRILLFKNYYIFTK